MGRKKLSAAELVDAHVYGIWDHCYIAPPGDLDPDEDDPDGGVFDGVLAHGLSIDDVDRSQVPGWVETLKQSEAHLRRKRLQLEALLSARVCPSCGESIAGRADRRYCSSRCRVRAHRRHLGATGE